MTIWQMNVNSLSFRLHIANKPRATGFPGFRQIGERYIKFGRKRDRIILLHQIPSYTFDSFVNKMAYAYQLMKDRIEEKYAASDRQKQYYTAADGSAQDLTKEKELEMLIQCKA